MVEYILFMDILRQEGIEKFYKACQMHREYYKGYPKKYHPLTYFQDAEYMYQCPSDLSHMDILFVDNGRQNEIETFYEACQRHRDYYRGYPKAHHPLLYFKDQEYMWQCPPDMTPTYLGFPMYHVKYKQPVVLPNCTGRTSVLPALPERTLAGRFNKAACKVFVR